MVYIFIVDTNMWKITPNNYKVIQVEIPLHMHITECI